jgi:L-malate glycosyltransferase
LKTIIHLRSTFHAGGTENLIVRVFNRPSEKFRMLLVLMKPGPLMYDLNENSNKVYHFYRKYKLDIKFLVRLIKLARIERPYAIHTHQSIELIYASLVKIFVPSLKLYHQIHLHNPANTFWFGIEKIICRYLVRKVITVSNTLRDYQLKHGYPAEKTIVLYNIVSETNRIARADKLALLESVRYMDGDFMIAMIGNFVIEKDQETLARAFKILLAENNRIKLVFIGEQSRISEKCKRIFTGEELEKRVFFTGQIPNASEYIPLFNLFVFSSKIETFGVAAMEALLYEVPVIASDIPVMVELSENGKFFDLFPAGDHLVLSQKILKYIHGGADPARRKLARNHVLQNFSAEEYVNELEKIYEC